MPIGTYAIALEARDETHLEAVAGRLCAAGVPVVRVVESDGKYDGKLMALGVPPCQRQQVRAVLSDLPLLHRDLHTYEYIVKELTRTFGVYRKGWGGFFRHLKEAVTGM